MRIVATMQVRQVSAREQQQALTAGNIWAAVGPSSSLVPLALQHNNIALIAPASGTLLWSDLWVVPRGASGGHLQVPFLVTTRLTVMLGGQLVANRLFDILSGSHLRLDALLRQKIA